MFNAESHEQAQTRYEIHIASTAPDTATALDLTERLKAVGILQHDFFVRVINIEDAAENPFPVQQRPGGHDLSEPRTMASQIITDYDEAKRLALVGMRVIQDMNLQGNFEIETVIEDPSRAYRDTHVEAEFPGFKTVHDAPLYEFHIIWNGTPTDLPSYGELSQYLRRVSGYGPNQIVDFSEKVNDESYLSRVATIYLDSQDQVVRYQQLFGEYARMQDRELQVDTRLRNIAYTVGEKVNAVGEPM